ncbi:MAG: hypothetical protein BGO69_17085 [Bacteroidetes bacterium 46-16]|nr:MAG: hypothetical protein BGO69_17085 [Bacteroidetes bacterium 46-16]
MIRTTVCFFIFLCAFPSIVNAQDRYAHDNLMSTFGSNDVISSQNSIHVDYYTGRPIIGYKLFSYENNDKSLKNDVTLVYNNGGGNKVDELASDVGLGWTLFTGGEIVREIKGIPDDNIWGFLNADTVPSNTLIHSNPAILDKYLKDSIDGEFDTYSFVAGSTTGKFIIGKNGQILCIPQSNIKIEQIANPNTTPSGPMDSCQSDFFKITLDNGIKYFYEKYNCVAIKYYNNVFRYASTRWYLTKIVAPFDQDSIVYNYTTPEVKYTLADSTTLTYYIYDGLNQGYSFCGVPVDDRLQLNTSRDMTISSIAYPDGSTIIFNYDSFPRMDDPSNHALNNITIMNNNADTVYGYKFRYAYMSSLPSAIDVTYGNYLTTASMYNNSWDGNLHTNYYRLQLNGYDKFSGNDTLIGCRYMYNSTNLPARNYKSGVDHWGYFNGNYADTRLMTNNPDSFIYRRLPNLQYAKAKVLDSVTLSTGGIVSLDYELNTNHKNFVIPLTQQTASLTTVGGLRIKRLILDDGMSQNNQLVKDFKYVEEDGSSSGVLGNIPLYGFAYTENAVSATYDPGFALASICPNYGMFTPPNYFLVHGSNSLNSLLYTNGAPVGYDRVEEYFGTVNNFKKKTVYKFTTSEDYPSSFNNEDYNDLPFLNIPDLDFCKGLLLETATYNASGLLERKIKHQYSCYQYPYNIKEFKTIKTALNYYDVQYYPDTNSFVWKYSYPITGKVFETKTIDSQFYANNKYIVDTTRIFYDTAHNIIDYTLATNALNEQIKTKYYYPVSFTYGAYSTLTAKNIWQPIRVEKWNNTLSQRLINASIVEYSSYNNIIKPYKFWSAVSNQVITASTWTYNAGSIIPDTNLAILQSTMNNYDEKGNVLQVTTKDQTSCNVWGYNKLLNIATVNNAGVNDVAYTSFENENELGGWTITGTLSYNASPYTDHALTGESYLYLQGSNNLYKDNLDSTKKYILSFWIDSTQSPPTVIRYPPTGSPWSISPTASDIHNGWQLYTIEVTNAVKVSLSTYGPIPLDEVRLYPAGASMISYTFDPLFGIKSVCDPSNHVSYTEYDNLGRLKYQKDMNTNILKSFDYKNLEPQN